MRKVKPNAKVQQAHVIIDYASPTKKIQKQSPQLQESRKSQLKNLLISLLKNSQNQSIQPIRMSLTYEDQPEKHKNLSHKKEKKSNNASKLSNSQIKKNNDGMFHKKLKLKCRMAKEFSIRNKAKVITDNEQIFMEKSNNFMFDSENIDKSIEKQKKEYISLLEEINSKKPSIQQKLKTQYPTSLQASLKSKTIKISRKKINRNAYHSQQSLQSTVMPLVSNLPIKVSYEKLKKIVNSNQKNKTTGNHQVQQQVCLGNSLLMVNHRSQYYAPKLKSSSLKNYYSHQDSLFIY